MDMYVDIFDKKVHIDWDFGLKQIIKALGVLSREIDSKKIIDYCSYFPIHWRFETTLNDEYFYGNDLLRWMMKRFNTDNWESLAVEDKVWTENRNKDLTGKFYSKVKFNEDVQIAVREECDRLIIHLHNELDKYLAEEQAKKETKANEKAELLNGVEWTKEVKAIRDEGGKTYEIYHTLIINNKMIRILERNVFDFGRVLNRPSGGMYSHQDGRIICEHLTEKDGWVPEEVCEEEARAAEIVFKYGDYSKSCIRM